jgi:hypothetical protein
VTVVVDAENVRRSLWPNLGRGELVRLCEAWAEREGHRLLVVFEAAGESADDRIAAWAQRAAEPYWLVTSDRELRERAGGAAERVIGGGTFARTVAASSGRSGGK